MTKNEKIKQTRRNTMERRKSQTCAVCEVKLSKNKLNKTTKKQLKRMFLEAKWFYNHIISQQDIFHFNTKIQSVPVKLPNNTMEDRKIIALSEQIKQGVWDRSKKAMYSMSRLPSNERGKFKHKSKVNSIPLVQFNQTYKILKNKKYIKIQRIKQNLKVKGLEQIPTDAEIANANLIQRHDDYYLKITYFVPKEDNPKPKSKIGIDFGIETDLTFSNGIKLNIKQPKPKSVIRADKSVSRKKKGSKNREKARVKLQKAYAKENNQKKDKRNKIVSYLKDNFQIAIQDENISQWQKTWFGKPIQQSAIGGIIAGLKKHPHTHIVDKKFPSTKKCNKCGELNEINLSERLFKCSHCGHIQDRDVHSAQNILQEVFPMERRIMPIEEQTATEMLKYLKTIPNISASLTVDAGSRKLNVLGSSLPDAIPKTPIICIKYLRLKNISI